MRVKLLTWDTAHKSPHPPPRPHQANNPTPNARPPRLRQANNPTPNAGLPADSARQATDDDMHVDPSGVTTSTRK